MPENYAIMVKYRWLNGCNQCQSTTAHKNNTRRPESYVITPENYVSKPEEEWEAEIQGVPRLIADVDFEMQTNG